MLPVALHRGPCRFARSLGRAPVLHVLACGVCCYTASLEGENNYSELVSFVFLLLWVRLSIFSCVFISFPINGFCFFAHFSIWLLVFFSWFLGALSIVKRLFAQNDSCFLFLLTLLMMGFLCLFYLKSCASFFYFM